MKHKIVELPKETRGKYLNICEATDGTGDLLISTVLFKSRAAAIRSAKAYNNCKCGLGHDYRIKFVVPIFYPDYKKPAKL